MPSGHTGRSLRSSGSCSRSSTTFSTPPPTNGDSCAATGSTAPAAWPRRPGPGRSSSSPPARARRTSSRGSWPRWRTGRRERRDRRRGGGAGGVGGGGGGRGGVGAELAAGGGDRAAGPGPLWIELHRHHRRVAAQPVVDDDDASWARRRSWYLDMLSGGEDLVLIAERA